MDNDSDMPPSTIVKSDVGSEQYDQDDPEESRHIDEYSDEEDLGIEPLSCRTDSLISLSP